MSVWLVSRFFPPLGKPEQSAHHIAKSAYYTVNDVVSVSIVNVEHSSFFSIVSIVDFKQVNDDEFALVSLKSGIGQ